MRKIRAIFRILFQDNLNYRAQAVVWILTTFVPTMSTAFVWLAAFGSSQTLGGFDRQQILVYFLGSLILANFIVSSIAFDMGQEIKDGKLSFYLVRPIGYPLYTFLANLAWRTFRTILFIPFLFLVIAVAYSYVHGAELRLDWTFLGLVIMAHLISFFINFFVGSFALYMENMGAVAQVFILMNFLLSGQLAPISLMPHGLRTVAEFLPFRYVMSFPLEVLTGRAEHIGTDALKGVAWLVILAVGSIVFFNRGMKQYSAVGQ